MIKAKRLYVLQHQNAAEVAKAVKVTEKTMGKWIKEGNWKQEQLTDLEKHGLSGLPVDNNFVINDLKAYLEEVTPFLFGQIKPAIENYQAQLNLRI